MIEVTFVIKDCGREMLDSGIGVEWDSGGLVLSVKGGWFSRR